MKHLGRLLTIKENVSHFLRNVLGYDFLTDDLGQKEEELIDLIITTEASAEEIDQDSDSLNDRSQNPTKRWALRSRIIDELYNEKRIKDDDAISLGNGGAAPDTVINDYEATIILGLPASGKSSIATEIADSMGAYILDSDYAKRKLPEFIGPLGATMVHEESDRLIFNNGFLKSHNITSLFERCTEDGKNLVIPKIGSSEEKIELLAKVLKSFNYTVHLVLVSLNRKEATRRALKRFIKTERYVPLSLIFDNYSHEPILTYHRLQKKTNGFIDTFGAISTNTPNLREIIEVEKGSPVENLTAMKNEKGNE